VPNARTSHDRDDDDVLVAMAIFDLRATTVP
jgi:hypothetical protein